MDTISERNKARHKAPSSDILQLNMYCMWTKAHILICFVVQIPLPILLSITRWMLEYYNLNLPKFAGDFPKPQLPLGGPGRVRSLYFDQLNVHTKHPNVHISHQNPWKSQAFLANLRSSEPVVGSSSISFDEFWTKMSEGSGLPTKKHIKCIKTPWKPTVCTYMRIHPIKGKNI